MVLFCASVQQEVFPMRLKGVHLVNEAWYIGTLIAIIKPFMKQKMRKRVRKLVIHCSNLTCAVLCRSLITELTMMNSMCTSVLMYYLPHLGDLNHWQFLLYCNCAELNLLIYINPLSYKLFIFIYFCIYVYNRQP